MRLSRWSPAIALVVLTAAFGGCGKESTPTKPQAPGSIAVASTPEGAAIRLDGAATGTNTPDTLTGVLAGTHEIRLSLAGYEDWTGNVSVSTGRMAYVNAVIAGSVGSISVQTTPPGAFISINGTDTGLRTPAIVSNVAIGRVLLTLQGTDCDWSGSVTVVRNQTTAVAITLYVLLDTFDPGTAPSTYNQSSVDVDAAGNLYVAEYDTRTVTKLSPTGAILANWRPAHYPGGIAVASSGEIYTLGFDPVLLGATIIRSAADGTPLGSWGGPGTADGRFTISNYAIAVDAGHRVYVVDNGNRRVQKFDAQGSFLGKWTVNFNPNPSASYESGVAVDAAGYVWVAGYGVAAGWMWDKWSAEGSLLARVPGATPGPDLYVDGAGNLFAPTCRCNLPGYPEPVTRYSPSGKREQSFPIAGDILRVSGVAGDPAGRIYVTGLSSATGRMKVVVFGLAN